MNLLAESKHYIVYSEYETVILQIKESQRKIQIGDFYGDPQMAVISEDETFCVMCGCGVILYYLREPLKNMNITYKQNSGKNGDEMRKKYGLKVLNVFTIKQWNS